MMLSVCTMRLARSTSLDRGPAEAAADEAVVEAALEKLEGWRIRANARYILSPFNNTLSWRMMSEPLTITHREAMTMER